MIERYNFAVKPAGKVGAIAKRLEFYVKPVPPDTANLAAAVYGAAASSSSSAAASAAVAAISSANERVLHLNLQVGVAEEGDRVSLMGPSELDLKLTLAPRVNIKRKKGSAAASSTDFVPRNYEATFTVSVVAGAPARVQWLMPQQDEDGLEELQPIVVENGAGTGELQVCVCDAAFNRVSLGDAAESYIMNLCLDPSRGPYPGLFGAFVNNGCRVSLDREGVARFSPITISVKPFYFKQAQNKFVMVDIVAQLVGGGGSKDLITSVPLSVRVEASRVPCEIRVKPPLSSIAPSLGDASMEDTTVTAVAAATTATTSSPLKVPSRRGGASSGAASAAAAAAASSSAMTTAASAASSSLVNAPVTLSGHVDSELELRFALYDEAGRELSILELQKEFQRASQSRRLRNSADGGAAAAVAASSSQASSSSSSAAAAAAAAVEGDEASAVAAMSALAGDGDDDAEMEVEMACFGVGTGAAASSSTPRRKRVLTAKAAAAVSSSSKRRSLAPQQQQQIVELEESEIEVRGLCGVQKILLSSVGPDGLIRGVRLPAKVDQSIHASLWLKWQQLQGQFKCEFVVQPIYDQPVSMQCQVHAEPSVDEPFGAALQLQYFDKHSNRVLPPAGADLLLVVESVGAPAQLAVPMQIDGEEKVQEQESGSSSPRSSGGAASSRSTSERFLIPAAVAASNDPFAGVQLKSGRAGTYAVTISVPSMPELEEVCAHLKLTGGAVDHLRFVTPSQAITEASAELQLHTCTRSFLPPFRIVACDSFGNVCSAFDGDVTLRSALFTPMRKLVLRGGECVVPDDILVKYSTPDVNVGIAVSCVPTVVAAGGKAKARKAARSSKDEMKSNVHVHVSASHKLVQDFALQKTEAAEAAASSSSAAAAASASAAASGSHLVLRVGSTWPAVRVSVKFQSSSERLEEDDLTKFGLTVTCKGRSSGGGGAASAASRNNTFAYPAPTIEAGGQTLLFQAPSSELVRHAEDHRFVIRFEESAAALLKFLSQAEAKREKSFVLKALCGPARSVDCTATILASSFGRGAASVAAAAQATRAIATGVTFKLLDAFGNIIPLNQLPDEWKNEWSKLQATVVRKDDSSVTVGAGAGAAAAASSSGPVPSLVTPFSLTMHADFLEIATLSVRVGQAPLGSYEVRFVFPHLPAASTAPITPLLFHVTDNSQLSQARTRLTEKMTEQQIKLATTIRQRKEAQADLEMCRAQRAQIKGKLAQCATVDGLPAELTLDAAHAAVAAELRRVESHSRPTFLPAQYRLTSAEQHILKADPDYLGPLLALASPLGAESDCRILSWFYKNVRTTTTNMRACTLHSVM